MRYLFLVLRAIVIVIPSQSAQASDICWVAHVLQQGDGVAVIFSNTHRIFVHKAHAKSTEAAYIKFDPGPSGYQQLDAAYKPLGQPIAAILMDVGDSATIFNSPEDSCTIYAIRKDGVLGISASAFFFSNLPNAKPWTREEFTAAVPPVTPAPVITNNTPPTVPTIQ